MPLNQRHRNALVTGAGSGLGAAFVEMLLAENIRVWGTSRDPSRLAVREDFFPITLELADGDSIERAWSEAERASGGIDLLINNAGSGVFGPAAEAEGGDAWAQQIAILLLGPQRLSRLAFSAMRTRARGAIVNVSSLAVEFPIPFMSAYNAGKSALSAWSVSLGLEAAGTGVTVIDFRPGDHRTNFNRTMISSAASNTTASARAARVWSRLEAVMAAAPAPQLAARDLRRALERGRHGIVRSGDFFQARLAPFLQRFAPARLSAWVQRRYFHAS